MAGGGGRQLALWASRTWTGAYASVRVCVQWVWAQGGAGLLEARSCE